MIYVLQTRVTEIHVKDVLHMVEIHAGNPVYHVIHVHHSGLAYYYVTCYRFDQRVANYEKQTCTLNLHLV